MIALMILVLGSFYPCHIFCGILVKSKVVSAKPNIICEGYVACADSIWVELHYVCRTIFTFGEMLHYRKRWNIILLGDFEAIWELNKLELVQYVLNTFTVSILRLRLRLRLRLLVLVLTTFTSQIKK
jgi:hypothetical protein